MSRQVPADNISSIPTSIAEDWMDFYGEAAKRNWTEKVCPRCGNKFFYLSRPSYTKAGLTYCNECVKR